MRKDEVMKLSEMLRDETFECDEEMLDMVAKKAEQLEVENKVLQEGIIRTLQTPIGAVLDQHTRFALTDALKEE